MLQPLGADSEIPHNHADGKLQRRIVPPSTLQDIDYEKSSRWSGQVAAGFPPPCRRARPCGDHHGRHRMVFGGISTGGTPGPGGELAPGVSAHSDTYLGNTA